MYFWIHWKLFYVNRIRDYKALVKFIDAKLETSRCLREKYQILQSKHKEIAIVSLFVCLHHFKLVEIEVSCLPHVDIAFNILRISEVLETWSITSEFLKTQWQFATFSRPEKIELWSLKLENFSSFPSAGNN